MYIAGFKLTDILKRFKKGKTQLYAELFVEIVRFNRYLKTCI